MQRNNIVTVDTITYEINDDGAKVLSVNTTGDELTIPEEITYCTKGLLSSKKHVAIVTSIDDNAFVNSPQIKHLFISKFIRFVGISMLYCNMLSFIEVDQGNQYYSSENGILYDKNKRILIRCPANTIEREFTVRPSVISLEGYSFYGCPFKKISLPPELTSIHDFTFTSCKLLQIINIPASVEKIGCSAFMSCDNLNQIYFYGHIKNIGKYAFKDCISLEKIIVCGYIGRVDIGAFENCNNKLYVMTDIETPKIVRDCFPCNTVFMLNNQVHDAVMIDDSSSKEDNYDDIANRINAESHESERHLRFISMFKEMDVGTNINIEKIIPEMETYGFSKKDVNMMRMLYIADPTLILNTIYDLVLFIDFRILKISAETGLDKHDITEYINDLKGTIPLRTEYFIQQRDKNDPISVFIQAYKDLNTDDVEKKSQAIISLEKLADNGLFEAQLQLALDYYEGTNVIQSLPLAIKWASLAAKANYPRAQFLLGLYLKISKSYCDGDTLFWLKKAAENNETIAQTTIGIMYQSGDCVEQSYNEANKWFMMAANNEDPEAQFYLAMNYTDGKGIEKSEYESFKWSLKAANNGYKLAQFNVATIYLEGRIVNQSISEAKKYIKMAADAGDTDAKKWLNDLNNL